MKANKLTLKSAVNEATRARKNSIGVAILLLLGLCNTIIGCPRSAWAILLILKSGAILLLSKNHSGESKNCI